MLPATVVISRGKLDLAGDNSFVIEKSQKIADQNEIAELFSILQDVTTFGEDGMRCFLPGMQIEYLLDKRETKHQICLECMWLKTFYDGKGEPLKALSDKGKARFSAVYQRLFG
jgi:hypothetical protein